MEETEEGENAGNVIMVVKLRASTGGVGQTFYCLLCCNHTRILSEADMGGAHCFKVASSG